MTGGGIVGVAEVVIYTGYLRKVNEAKQKERKKVEKKEVVESWVIEPRKLAPEISVDGDVRADNSQKARLRKPKPG